MARTAITDIFDYRKLNAWESDMSLWRMQKEYGGYVYIW